MTPSVERQQVWQQLVSQVRSEYLQLAADEQAWIKTACDEISRLQDQLDQLFRRGDGQQQCRDCQGDCCALGHNHLTLANLLLLICQNELLPGLDFAATCPLLGTCGCMLPAGQRPYNCISFLCDRIEERLSTEEVADFYRLEKQLRKLYRLFAERYAGGSMTGLLLVSKRLEGRPFLQRRDHS